MKKTAISIALLSTLAFAHDAWIQQTANDNATIFWGHLGKELKTLDTAKIQKIDGYDKNGKKTELKAEVKEQNTSLKITPKTAVTLMELAPSYKVQTTEGTKYGIGKRAAQGNVVSSSKGIKYSKAIFFWSDKLSKPTGAPLEIVTLNNPFKAKVGNKISVQTFKDSKPIGGLKLVVDGEHDVNKTITTDANGKADILVGKKGLKLIATKKESPLTGDLDADTLTESANVSFVIK